MKCKGVRKQIQSLVAGELDKTTATRVLEHIESCTECAKEKIAYERLIADLSTPRPMAAMPAGLEELRIPDEPLRRAPTLRLAMLPMSAIVVAMVLLISTHMQPTRIPVANPPQPQVAQVKQLPDICEPPPVPPVTRQVERRVVAVRKQVIHPKVVARRHITPRVTVKRQPTPIQQVRHSENVAQVPEEPSRIDLEVIDSATGQTYIESRVGDGAVCSVLIY